MTFSWLKRPTFFVHMALAALTIAAVPSPAFAAEGTETETTHEMVRIAVELSAGDKALGAAQSLSDFGTDAKFAVDAEGRAHRLQVKVRQAGDAMTVDLAYRRDGKRIVHKTKLQASPNRPMVLEAGGIKIALRLAPQLVDADGNPVRGKIQLPDGNEPLAGL